VSRAAIVGVALLAAACGKKGPPLPPLVRLPAAPADLAADRRGNTVDLRFTVPSTNTDNTRPANIARVELYAFTEPTNVPDDQVLKRATKVATVPVKAPRDPDRTVEEDEPPEDMEPPVGAGLDQGAVAHFTEPLSEQALTPVDLTKESRAVKPPTAPNGDNGNPRPLLGPPRAFPSRTYVGVGLTPRGRRGPLSKRVAVPLVPPPPVPAPPTISYDEQRVTVTWDPVTPAASIQAPATDEVLPSRPIGVTEPTIAYNVYDVSSAAAAAADAVSSSTVPPASSMAAVFSRPSQSAGVKLTGTAVTGTEFADARIVWGEQRCYTVRTVETIGGLIIESDAARPVCETLTDTFPPGAPKNLKTVSSDGTISLIWDPNTEKDLAGYLIFRGTGETLQQITPTPISDTHFEDNVQPGLRYAYAVKAVDRTGNVSGFSNRQEETAR
jgi:hypothetical protein